jgi:putative ABC transport system substrate-binding protein
MFLHSKNLRMNRHISARLRHRMILVALLVLMFLPNFMVYAIAEEIGIVYPELREPYKAIFDSIIEGIDEALPKQTLTYALDGDDNSSLINAWVENNKLDGVIFLGRAGFEIAQESPDIRPRVFGAVVTTPADTPKGLIGITQIPDPEKMLQNLKSLASNVRRITVVYTEENSAWLIPKAEQAASQYGYVLNKVLVTDLREAANFYRSYFDTATKEDALWLLQDSKTIDNGPVLSDILKNAWSYEVTVFSSNPAHVPRGALFSLYPSNRELGIHLGQMMQEQIKDRSITNGVHALIDVKIAVNIRTAEHLGYSYSGSQRRNFGLVFPSRP